tara:strand:- start:2750 stop:3112 length:363 start_codon:yes stop_codon:yes gene_type:complete
MRSFILALAAAIVFALPAHAIDLGNGISLDNEIKAKYNVDTETSDLTAQTGVTVGVWVLDMSVDADFDLLSISDDSKDLYQGIDIGVDWRLHDSLVIELDTGINTDWERENISLSATLSF